MWLSVSQMAQLFDREESNIRRHVLNVFNENELDSKQIFSVIERYNSALDLLDAYDHQTMNRICLVERRMTFLKAVLELQVGTIYKVFFSAGLWEFNDSDEHTNCYSTGKIEIRWSFSEKLMKILLEE